MSYVFYFNFNIDFVFLLIKLDLSFIEFNVRKLKLNYIILRKLIYYDIIF